MRDLSNNFREELKAVNYSISGFETTVLLLKTELNLDIARTLQFTDSLKYELDSLQVFFEKYYSLFDSIDKQCGSEFSSKSNLIKKIINDMRNSIKQLELAVSKTDFNSARIFRAEIIKQISEIKPALTNIITVPIVIDFSKLSDLDWKRIGTPGIHYKSRVFLSYPFRDQNPIKDTNQELIDHYIIIPFLKS